MAELKDQHRRYIVQRLACYDTPSEVAQAVAEDFGVEIDRRQVAKYDPTGVAGRNLAKKWRQLFEETRERFEAETDQVPIAQRAFRLRELHKAYQEAKRRKNYPLAAQLLEQAAKERGEMFTNRRELTGAGGGPVKTEVTGFGALMQAMSGEDEGDGGGTGDGS